MKIGIVDAILVGLVVVGAGVFIALGGVLIVNPRSIGTGFLQDNIVLIFGGGAIMLIGIIGLALKKAIIDL